MLPFMAVFPAGAAASAAPSGAACTLSGTLSATGSSSSVSSATRVVTVPIGNSGVLRFTSVIALVDPSVLLRVQIESGMYTTVSEGSEVTVADGNDLRITISSTFSFGDGYSFDLVDATTGSTIGSYEIYRT